MRLKEVRNSKFLSQEDLAEQSGVAASTIVRIEQGVVVPNPSTLRKLATALGVDPSELVTDPAAYGAARARRRATSPRKLKAEDEPQDPQQLDDKQERQP